MPLLDERWLETNMASSSKQLDPHLVNTEALEKKSRQLRCINRRCCYGDTLSNAVELVCAYYEVDYKPGKEVCMTCLTKCLKHYKHLETKWKDGQCIMDTSFPSFDTYLVVDDSSSSEGEEEEEKPKPSTSKVGSPPDQDVKNAINSAVTFFFNKNKSLFERQVKLCDEFIDREINQCLIDADEIDKLASDIENQMASLRNEIYHPYQPIITHLEPVDINELEENIETKQEVKTSLKEDKTSREEPKTSQEEVKKSQEEIKTSQEEVKTSQKKARFLKRAKVTQEEINKLIEKYETPIEAKRIKLDKSNKEDVITINTKTCTVPNALPKEGHLVYTNVVSGQVVFAMKLGMKDPWYRCKVKSIVSEGYIHVTFQNDEKLLTSKEIAYASLSPVRFPVGCRVIAKFTHSNSKCIDEFYAGIIAEPPKTVNEFRYLIFFDVGYVQYRKHYDIRLVVHETNPTDVWNVVDESCRELVKNYLEKYPERLMVKLTNQHSVRAKYKGQWLLAKVLEVDVSLVKLYFHDFKHSEWIYRGSSRLYNIVEKQSKSEKGIRLRQSGLAYLKKPFVEFTSVEEESSRPLAKSTSKILTLSEGTQKFNKNKIVTKVIDIILPKSIPSPIKYRKHNCNPNCIAWTAYSYERTRKVGMLAIPLYFGFVRYLALFSNTQKCVLYKTPCGITVRNIKQMLDYLVVTKSTMTIDQFDFNSWVKPFAEYKVIKTVQCLNDISEGKEFRVIPCVNTINNILPPKMNYMTTRQPMPGVNINLESEFLCGCDCTDNCQDKSKCACWQMTIEGQKILPNLYKDPNIGYNYRRLPERVLTGIYECNKTCKCSSSCLNRVVQNPLSQKLQLFMTKKKGWGVKCLNDIPQGSFICIYVGYLLTETDANEGGKNYGDEYLAELDYIEVVEKIKEDYESDVSSSDYENEIEPNPSESSDDQYPCISDGRRSEMTLRKRKKSKTEIDDKHVQALPKLNANNMKNNPEPTKSIREYFGENESVYIMDAKTSGNIGRYLNHSCSPNTFVQNVFVDTHDLRFPWVSFFALHYIQAGTELTWDYSYDVGSVPGKNMKCHCESAYCRKRLL
ncbi:hypothetical protein ACI65C_005819 [Semiaphis heraclei]